MKTGGRTYILPGLAPSAKAGPLTSSFPSKFTLQLFLWQFQVVSCPCSPLSRFIYLRTWAMPPPSSYPLSPASATPEVGWGSFSTFTVSEAHMKHSPLSQEESSPVDPKDFSPCFSLCCCPEAWMPKCVNVNAVPSEAARYSCCCRPRSPSSSVPRQHPHCMESHCTPGDTQIYTLRL